MVNAEVTSGIHLSNKYVKNNCHKPASQLKCVDAKQTAKRQSPVNSNQDIQKKFRFSSVHNCDICGEIFNTSSLLQNHTQSCHMESEADLLGI